MLWCSTVTESSWSLTRQWLIQRLWTIIAVLLLLRLQAGSLWYEVMATIKAAMDKSKKIENLSALTAAKFQNSASGFKRWGRKSPFIRYGLPMISLTVFGALGLGHLLQGRLELLSIVNLSSYHCIVICLRCKSRKEVLFIQIKRCFFLQCAM